jgi:hypothetical protein
MLSISAESFSSTLLSKKYKYQNIQKYSMAVVMYGCDTLFLILGEEHKLRVFENGVLRKIRRFRKDKVIGEWRILHNEGLYDLYSPLNIIQVIKSRSVRWIGACTMNGGDERCIQGFGGGNLRARDHVGDLGID